MARRLVVAAWAILLAAGPPAARAADDLTKRIDAVIDGPDYVHAHWGALVVDAKTCGTVYARNADKMFAPASVAKLFSCAAALVAIGPDHTFETTVYQRGLHFGGVLRGDLVLVAGGDLMLGGRTKADGTVAFKDHDHTYAGAGLGDAELTDTDPLAGLAALAKRVKAAGIKEVDGDVLVDDRLFVKARGSGSGPDLVTPVVVNDNLVDVTVEPGAKAGDPAVVRTRPVTAAIQVDALVTTGAAGSNPDLHMLAVGPAHFAVRGRVPAGGKPAVRSYPVEDPTAFARTLFIEAMRREGIAVQAALGRPGPAVLPAAGQYDKLKKVASLASVPLRDLTTVTLKVSHNLYASTLPALVAVKRGKTTVEAGLAEQGKVLKELGVDLDAVSLGGGAGGGRADFVSPRATVQLLQGMAKRSEWAAFRAGLPGLGVDGTLAEVVGADSTARGKVQAKTGTLYWLDPLNERVMLNSKAMAGTLTTKAGSTLYFALFVNNNPLPSGVSVGREGKVLGKLCELIHDHGP